MRVSSIETLDWYSSFSVSLGMAWAGSSVGEPAFGFAFSTTDTADPLMMVSWSIYDLTL
jgi:hypothetical protein